MYRRIYMYKLYIWAWSCNTEAILDIASTYHYCMQDERQQAARQKKSNYFLGCYIKFFFQLYSCPLFFVLSVYSAYMMLPFSLYIYCVRCGLWRVTCVHVHDITLSLFFFALVTAWYILFRNELQFRFIWYIRSRCCLVRWWRMSQQTMKCQLGHIIFILCLFVCMCNNNNNNYYYA